MPSFSLEDIDTVSLAAVEDCIEEKRPFEILATGANAKELKDVLLLGKGDVAPISPSRISASNVMLVFGFTTVGLLSRAMSLGFKIHAQSDDSDDDRVFIKFEPASPKE